MLLSNYYFFSQKKASVEVKNLVPFWEKKANQSSGSGENGIYKKVVFYVKVILYSFSALMVLWSFIQSFAAPYTNYNPRPGHGLEFGYLPGKKYGTGDVKFDLGSWSITGPGYHAFWAPAWGYGPFLSWFVYPVARFFVFLIWTFHNASDALKNSGMDVIFAMLIIMFIMRFITFWTTLRSSVYQEKQLMHQSALDAIHAKYEKYDPTDKYAKLKKHQELTEYNRKYGLKPLAALENFFINTPIFLIVFKLITICRPIKFTILFGIWDLSETPSSRVFSHLTSDGYLYLLLCLIIIPTNFLGQKTAAWLSQIRNPSLKKQAVNKNSQSYKMQRIQKIMTLVFLLFTFFWSTSLAIYYFFNSIFTIFQNLVIHKILLNQKHSQNQVKSKLQKLGIE